MDVIGHFKISKQGGWEGRLHTLTLDRKIRLAPNDNRQTERAPSHIVLLGWDRVGEAWDAHSKGNTVREYLRVQLRDPTWTAPMRAMLFISDDGTRAELCVPSPPTDHADAG